MKIEIPNKLVDGVLDQLAATRGLMEEEPKKMREWDNSPLGIFYAMLSQESAGRVVRRGSSSSTSNRARARSRFQRSKN